MKHAQKEIKLILILWVVLLCSPFVVTPLFAQGEVSFLASRYFKAGMEPYSVVVEDFNGDKILDLAVANLDSNDVSILLGIGDGTFDSARGFVVGDHPSSLAVGDFDGDKVPDLAVANSYSNTVTILLGQGDGTFGSARDLKVSGRPWSITVGDFDGDDLQDLAVSNGSILLGNGDGTFRSARSFEIGNRPTSIAVGDFNSDKIPDLALANSGYGGDTSTVSVVLGQGDGTFGPAQYLRVGPDTVSVTVGDFNGDKIPDLAATATILGRVAIVAVLLGNGDGTFGSPQNFEVGREPVSITVGDFNGDAIPDLVVTNSESSAASVLLGNGDGTFQSARNFPVGRYPISIAVGDFNGDELPDLAVANSGSNTVSILINDTVQR